MQDTPFDYADDINAGQNVLVTRHDGSNVYLEAGNPLEAGLQPRPGGQHRVEDPGPGEVAQPGGGFQRPHRPPPGAPSRFNPEPFQSP